MSSRKEKEIMSLMKRRIIWIVILAFLLTNAFLIYEMGKFDISNMLTAKYILGSIIYTLFFSGLITPIYAYIAVNYGKGSEE